ncbi:MAG TPA: hypothetical protein PLC74_00560 [Acetobacteraceae bacterium]|nr:hypothetical protein [Acetobacteraceae bacterium]
MRLRPSARVAYGVYVGGFGFGVLAHAHDFLTHGWHPYEWGVPVLDGFWTALIGLDTLPIILILTGWRRLGLAVGLTIMILDVSANHYALFVLKFQPFAGPLMLQSIFLGYVLGCIGFLWRDRPV